MGGRRVALRGVISLLDQAASSAATFLTSAIIARSCPKEQFGLFALSLTVLAWTTNMQSAFVTTPYIYGNASLDSEGRKAYAGSTLIAQVVYTVAAMIVLLGVAWALSHGVAYVAFAPIIATLGLMLWFLLVKEYCRQMAFAHLDVTSALWLDTSVGLLQIGGLLALMRMHEMSVPRAYGIIGIASGLPAVAWMIYHRKVFHFQREAIAPALCRNWEFGRWLPGGYVMNAASRDAYPWLVTAFRGAAATGTLAACTGIAFLVTPIITGISNVLAPTFAKHYAEGGVSALRRIVVQATVLGSIGIAIYCVFMAAFGGWVASLIYGPTYTGDGMIVFLLALSVAATVVSTPVGMAMYVVRRADINFQAAGAAVVVVVVLGVMFVRTWGVVGAAAALVCGNAAESAYKWFRYQSVLRADELRA